MKKTGFKTISILLTILMLTTMLAGCSGSPAGKGEKNDKLSIVTTIFPEYDWVREITAGTDGADVTLLLSNGVDLHSFQPTADDVIKISSCDVFVYVGGESDEWVDDVLKEATNKDMVVISLMDVLGDSVKPEELVDGMQESEHEHGEEAEEEEEEEEEEMDEHVWLSLKNAKTICSYIAEQLATLDEENASAYRSNAENYGSKLEELNEKYGEAVASASKDTLLFGDRFPFRYLTDDYGLSYYAAFVGCSAETEASFETIRFLSKKVDELGLSTVLAIEGGDQKIAQTVIDNTAKKDQKILVLNSLQSVTTKDMEAGVTYLSIMENNLETLQKALQ